MSPQKSQVLFLGPMLGRHSGWVPNPAEVLAAKLKHLPVEVRLSCSAIGGLRRALEMCLALWSGRRSLDAAVILVYSGQAFRLANLTSSWARSLGIPVIYWLHGGDLPATLANHPKRFRAVMDRAIAHVVPTSFLASSLASAGFKPTVIANPLDLSKYRFRNRVPLRPRILWMRTFHPIYEPQVALEAFAILRKSHPDARLTMAGQDRGMLDSIITLARSLGIADAVEFPGFLTGELKTAVFEQHDIYLHTNSVDNAPITVLEAAACGMPIVATNAGGVPDLVSDEETALLVPVRDAEASAKALARLLDDPGLSRKIVHRARSLAEQSDCNVVAQRWVELIARHTKRT